MDQKSLFDVDTMSVTKQDFWQNWHPVLAAACEDAGYPSSCISYRDNKNGSRSVLFLNAVMAQIVISKKSQFVSTPFHLSDEIASPAASGKGYKLVLSTALSSETAGALINAAIKALPKTYDCCSAYMTCSNARRCVNSSESALGCGYRRVLSSGRIFYGKNRNV